MRKDRCAPSQAPLLGRSDGCGAVAQMGERCNRTAEVRSSILLSSTSPVDPFRQNESGFRSAQSGVAILAFAPAIVRGFAERALDLHPDIRRE